MNHGAAAVGGGGGGDDIVTTKKNVIFDDQLGKYTYTDSEGISFEWDDEKNAWFPMVNVWAGKGLQIPFLLRHLLVIY